MYMREDCPFCRPGAAVLQNALAFALLDKSPVTPGHMLLIPRRHVADWFETMPEERHDLLAFADEDRAWLVREHRPMGSISESMLVRPLVRPYSTFTSILSHVLRATSLIPEAAFVA